MLIENVKESDLPNLAELFSTSFPYKLKKEDSENLMKVYFKVSNLFLVAKIGDKVIGFVFSVKNAREFLKTLRYCFTPLWPHLRPVHESLYLINAPYVGVAAVDVKHRREGVATKLFESLKFQLRNKGYKKMYFEILRNNIASQKLVKKVYDCKIVSVFPSKVQLWCASLSGD
ncbi:MAG TPA: GNAT family N-acetyltransferase [Candidatus Nanoarchaeia archaeon]|nr:GNAT family N-acetyltransferase [Candidatus Nanoarchaeia archaeon]